MNTSTQSRPVRLGLTRLGLTRRPGFTLVELLVVMMIIGILVGLLLPAIWGVLENAKHGAIKTEVTGISSSVEHYNNKYGDYPPDFLSWPIVARHYRKAFPNIAPAELALLQRACDTSIPNDSDLSIAITAHDPTKMDRAEVIYWSLGGFSSDPQFPFTGPGGPIQHIGSGDIALPVNYQVNIARENSLFDFNSAQLTLSSPDAGSPLSVSNRTISTDEGGTNNDLFPVFRNNRDGAYVYFDSRTYAAFAPGFGFNGWVDPTSSTNLVRPYVSDQPVLKTGTAAYGSLAAAMTAWEFVNPNTFQVISAGLDGQFGQTAFLEVDSSSSGLEPVYFMYPSGRAIAANSAATSPNALIIPDTKAFQEKSAFGASENFQMDNITNYSNAKVADDVP